jgi:hypothetical protein
LPHWPHLRSPRRRRPSRGGFAFQLGEAAVETNVGHLLLSFHAGLNCREAGFEVCGFDRAALDFQNGCQRVRLIRREFAVGYRVGEDTN